MAVVTLVRQAHSDTEFPELSVKLTEKLTGCGPQGCWIPDKRFQNERKKEIRSQEKQEEQASSRRDNLRTAEDNGNLEISGFLTDWIVMKIADFGSLLTHY